MRSTLNAGDEGPSSKELWEKLDEILQQNTVLMHSFMMMLEANNEKLPVIMRKQILASAESSLRQYLMTKEAEARGKIADHPEQRA